MVKYRASVKRSLQGFGSEATIDATTGTGRIMISDLSRLDSG